MKLINIALNDKEYGMLEELCDYESYSTDSFFAEAIRKLYLEMNEPIGTVKGE